MIKNIGANYRICCSCWYNKLQPSGCRVGNSSRFERWTKFPPCSMFLGQRMPSCIAVLVSLLLPSFPLQGEKHLRTKSFVLISKPLPDPRTFCGSKSLSTETSPAIFSLEKHLSHKFPEIPWFPRQFLSRSCFLHMPYNLAVLLGECHIYGGEIVSCTISRQPYSQRSHTCSCQMTSLTYMVPCMIKVAGRCISEADTVMCVHSMQVGRNLGLGHKQKPPWDFVKEIRFSCTNSNKNLYR